MNNELWYKNAVFYEVSVSAFKDGNFDGRGDLQGLSKKLDYLQNLGVDCIWLMPIYPSPWKDDGYDIADYYNIASAFGNLEDFKSLIENAHVHGIRVIMDLVMNHTSDEHPWFQSARADQNSPFRDYYVWSDTDKKYKEARIIFTDVEPSNWTWDEKAGQYYWHRFYASQPDLNFDNPKVQEEMLNIARFWLDMGIDGFRVDAVPYLFERENTNCENLPETHTYLKKLRAFMDANYPSRILLCEANQWPEDVRPYFGDGDEFHMGFHFPIMPRIYMALKKGRVDDMLGILNRTPSIPDNCQWCTFLRNHDELTLEMVTSEERQWMWKQYAPEPRMRLNQGIRPVWLPCSITIVAKLNWQIRFSSRYPVRPSFITVMKSAWAITFGSMIETVSARRCNGTIRRTLVLQRRNRIRRFSKVNTVQSMSMSLRRLQIPIHCFTLSAA